MPFSPNTAHYITYWGMLSITRAFCYASTIYRIFVTLIKLQGIHSWDILSETQFVRQAFYPLLFLLSISASFLQYFSSSSWVFWNWCSKIYPLAMSALPLCFRSPKSFCFLPVCVCVSIVRVYLCCVYYYCCVFLCFADLASQYIYLSN